MSELSVDKGEGLAKACGLSAGEWEHLLKTLGRSPTSTEIQMIGVMWSEHCSYKSSKHFLKLLVTQGSQVLQGPGENAGLIALDRKRAIAFKVESHNHPSFVEPFQGAATGVGGILRDIFTMGTRPIAVGNYLRFGELSSEKHRHLLEGVVGGIAHYGNCMGIPTVAGHISTNACYQGNILVNVFAMGIGDRDNLYRSSTGLPGHSVLILGAKTGRDGIHGASLLASADFESSKTETKEQKIRVQVGDPFKEKVLMEATLEAMRDLKDDLLCIQDMGAAGLTCSTMEISHKSQIGMTINLNQVPMRETGMKAYELLLSESQERMLAIVRRGSEENFKKVFSKWGCECEAIGVSTDSGRLRMEFDGQLVVDLPVADVMDPPAPQLPKPEYPPALAVNGEFPQDLPADLKGEWEVLKKILAHPSVASKRDIYQRYDSTVGAATVFGPGHDAALLWVGDESQPYLGVAFKGAADEELYQVDANQGAKAALARAVRSLALVGCKALAYTDGVNIGNPYNPRVQGALEKTVEGLNEAALIFDTPCVGGNVSMYNQTKFGEKTIDIFPTIFTVAVGVMKDVRKAVPSHFQAAGNEVWLLETAGGEDILPSFSLYSRLYWPSEYQNRVLPFLDLKAERRLQLTLLAGIEADLFVSSRDISQGGLAVALAKSCFGDKKLGFDGDWSKTGSRRDQSLFGENHGRVIVEVKPEHRSDVMRLGIENQLQVKRLGQVATDGIFRIAPLLSGQLQDLFSTWSRGLSDHGK